MLENGGVKDGTGVLLVAACSPTVTPAHLTHPTLSSLATVHTLALCPTTSPLFDQLGGGSGQAWVLSGPPPPSPPAAGKTGQVGGQWAGKVLTAATQSTLSTPTQSSLVLVRLTFQLCINFYNAQLIFCHFNYCDFNSC